MKNMLPKWNITTHFVDITKLDVVEAAINKNTKVLYCETVSNPLLEVANIKALAQLAQKYQLKLVVDNTFSFKFDALPFRISNLRIETEKHDHWTEYLDERLQKIAAVFELLEGRYDQLRPELIKG